ncbi:MAG: hypothetical protein P4L66_09925 [Acetobacteraceae bacterium]|nr:hypothetical protein [Acetobacteraceae bacterium]
MSTTSKFALAALLVSFTLPALAQDKPLTPPAKPTATVVSGQAASKPVPGNKASSAKTEIAKTATKQPAPNAAPSTKIN